MKSDLFTIRAKVAELNAVDLSVHRCLHSRGSISFGVLGHIDLSMDLPIRPASSDAGYPQLLLALDAVASYIRVLLSGDLMRMEGLNFRDSVGHGASLFVGTGGMTLRNTPIRSAWRIYKPTPFYVHGKGYKARNARIESPIVASEKAQICLDTDRSSFKQPDEVVDAPTIFMKARL